MINSLCRNLTRLRKYHHLSQEEVAERIGVTRQAVAKWENGESAPDIGNCDALAALYQVTLDDLVRYNEKEEGMPIPPKGKHIFGTVTVGERGQIVLPKKAREVMKIKPGDSLMVLGDENPESAGLALVHSEQFLQAVSQIMKAINQKEES